MWTTEDAAAAAQFSYNGRRELGASPIPEWASERLLPPLKPTFQDRLYWDSKCHQQKRLTFVNKGELLSGYL